MVVWWHWNLKITSDVSFIFIYIGNSLSVGQKNERLAASANRKGLPQTPWDLKEIFAFGIKVPNRMSTKPKTFWSPHITPSSGLKHDRMQWFFIRRKKNKTKKYKKYMVYSNWSKMNKPNLWQVVFFSLCHVCALMKGATFVPRNASNFTLIPCLE